MSNISIQSQEVLNFILENLEQGYGVWKKGYEFNMPKSYSTGKPYLGKNSLYLIKVTQDEKYTDSRWITYPQMLERGLSFKKDSNGDSLSKGKGIPIEYFQFFDKGTKKKFDLNRLNGLSSTDKIKYLDTYADCFKKKYVVFNCSLVEGVEKEQRVEISNKDFDNFIELWSKNESQIVFGDFVPHYDKKEDKIYIPSKSSFISSHEYYSTIFHEMAHSTGHEKRLNRPLKGVGETEEYAEEELRAELTSIMFEFTSKLEKDKVNNNLNYIGYWKDKITKNPNSLFEAIVDAEKITMYFNDFISKNMYITQELKNYSKGVVDMYKDTGKYMFLKEEEKDVIRRVLKTKDKEIFTRLYEDGEKVFLDNEKNDREIIRILSENGKGVNLINIIKSGNNFDNTKGLNYYISLLNEYTKLKVEENEKE